jgi:2-oxoglutarate/2-oxoacid ferredoxin oxidoreductase subunit alpha
MDTWMSKNITLRIVGESGEGIISTGEILSRLLQDLGQHLLTFRTFPAEIKGGQCLFQLRFSKNPLHTAGENPEILVCFDEKSYFEHGLNKDSGILIYNSDDTAAENSKPLTSLGVPFTSISRDDIGKMQSKNMVALGAVGFILDLKETEILQFAEKWFAKKGTQAVEANTKALKAGYLFAKENYQTPLDVFPSTNNKKTILLSGNQALVLGALAAGCQFYAGYPITPASNIMEMMIKELPKFGGIGIQTEDEMAAIAACIGASFAGKKVMTATSGPGFSLMQEQLGLASMAEIPLVVVDAQRAGPSTGMPTKMEQGDLLQAIHGTHGEGPRIVIAPGTVEECFSLTVKAFNLAESLRCPVVILSDLALAQRTASISEAILKDFKVEERPKFEANQNEYVPFEIIESSTSPMALPGQENGLYTSTGLEHDEKGRPSYTSDNHQKMVQKRFAKVYKAHEHFNGYKIFDTGERNQNLGIISWGSTEGPIREALELMGAENVGIPHLQIKMLNPLPDSVIKDFSLSVKKILVVEHNYQGQLAGLVESIIYKPVVRLLKIEGIPFYPNELVKRIKKQMDVE